MALITDPDVLSGNTLQVTVGSLTLTLSACESLSTDGVTIKCVYSKLKELWRSDSTYIKYPFPMTPITDEQFEMVNGWDWANDTTRYLLRTGGWAKKSAGGISEQEYSGIIGLGSLGAADQVYFQQGLATAAGSAAVNFQLAGQVNQAICVYSSGGTPGTFDYRTYLKLFCREWGKSFAYSDLDAIGVTILTYQAYRFPLSNASDIKVTLAMSALSAAPYTDITMLWTIAASSITVGASADNYHVIVDGSDENAEDIYQRVQYLFMQNSDIDVGAGLMIGKTAPTCLYFVGDTLYTDTFTIAPSGGTFIAGVQSDDVNRVVFVTDTGLERTYPYTAALTINFGENLQDDVWSKYWIYFTTNPSGDYGTSNAVIVDDASSIPMTGACSGVSSVQRTFAYDSNTQGGRSAGTTPDITAVAIGLSSSQFVKAATTQIARSTANSVSLVSALERNYANA